MEDASIEENFTIDESLTVDPGNVDDNLQNEEFPDGQEAENVSQVDDEPKEKLLRLPIARIKALAKMDSEVNLVNQEATFLIAKSTELFIDSITKESYKHTLQAKKRTIQKRDLEHAIDNIDALAFLEGMLDEYA